MLDTRLDRRPVSRLTAVGTLAGLLAVMVPIGGLAASQTPFVTVSGSIVDPMNAALPDVAVTMTNTASRAKYQVRSDRAGRYQFVGVQAGDYVLEAALPGFALLRSDVQVGAQDVERNLAMQIGSVRETIVVANVDTVRAPSSASQKVREERRAAAAKCGTGSAPVDARIGGNLRPPVKLTDVRPQYPDSLRASGTAGTVVLQGRIGTDGMVNNLTVVSTPHPDLAAAALDAVKQWEFDATLLNCVAVEVPITVQITFQPNR